MTTKCFVQPHGILAQDTHTFPHSPAFETPTPHLRDVGAKHVAAELTWLLDRLKPRAKH